MPRRHLLASHVPLLELSERDRDVLRTTAQALVDAATKDYLEDHRKDAALPTNQAWAQLKSSGRISVFRERQPVESDAGSLPHVMALGTTLGTLDDVMYGALAVTDDDLAMRARYMEDTTTVETKRLLTLVRPSDHEPFRQLHVHWSLFRLSSSSLKQQLSSPRDCTFLESTGITMTANGERLGYVLQHSVEFRALPRLEHVGVVRAQVATCAIFREVAPGVVHCVVKSFHDLGGSVWRHAALGCLSTRVLALCRLGHCAHLKKLARLMHASLWNHVDDEPPQSTGACVVCRSSLRVSLFGKRPARCSICRHEVCRRCGHNKKLRTTLSPFERTPAEHRVCVCACCIQASRQADAVCIALEEQQLDDDGFPTLPRVALTSCASDSTVMSSDVEEIDEFNF
ncbi:hypothetical protein P43SY_001350 [Pythium insidiosum]|uniref:FYVE-type domain-containing protein n=1 Tax=Pythium insidiosum TaxID=114742 RepID=A0AAD5M712_PYTIN|nr:hypothetical protein P43SY_001350 [Pythium insidiosum]KAJ0408068.1 hypothetical protein ATCC90586_006039 [Pythium insidiosum]